MSSASLSPESIVRARLSELNCAASFLAALSGVPQSRLSLVLSGQKDFSHLEGEMLKTLTARLVEIKDALGIVPLNLGDAKAVRRLLDAMDEANVAPSQLGAAIKNLFDK